jgi:PAS domain S-box-containing protein
MQIEMECQPTIRLAGSKNSPIHVLHVDDDPSILEITKQILMDTNCAFEVEQACCVDDAFKKLSTGHYDVVVSDYEMPQKDGLQFLTELRGQKNEIPFILFTGKGREEVAIEALNLGADAYINKQGNPETVYGELSHSLIRTMERKTTIEKLEKNEAQLKVIILNAPIGIAWSDSTMFFLSANEPFCKILGYSEQELQKLTFKDITHPDEIEESIAKMQELSSGCIHVFSIEKRYIRKDKTVIIGKVTVTAIRDSDGKPTLFVAELEDITEHKKAEAELIESQTNYRNLINSMMETAWVIDFDGNFVDVNNAAVSVLGYSKEELLSLGVKGIDKHLSQEQVRNLVSSIPTHQNQVFETVHTAKDGTEIPVEISFSFVNYRGKKAILSIARNITERKKTELTIKEDSVLRKTLLDNIPCTALILEKNSRKIVASNKIAKDAGAVPGETCYKTCANRSLPCTFCLAPKLWTTNKPQTLEVEHNGKFYRGIWMPYTKELYVHYIFDITETKKNEVALREKEFLFDKLASQTPGMLFQFLKRPDGTYCVPFSSNGIYDVFGCSPQDVKEDFSPIARVIVSDDLPIVVNSIEHSATNMTVWRCEYRVHLPGQEIRWMWGQSIPEKLKDGSILWSGYNTDITEQKKTKMELQESEERYRSLFEQAPLPVAITALDGTILNANIAMQTFTGYSLEELRKISVLSFYQNPKDRKKMLEIIERDSVVDDFFTLLKDKTNNIVDVVLNVSKFQIGKESFLRTTIQDITERVKAEETMNQIMDQLVLVNEKLGVVGSLTRHDVRNKLSAVTSYAYLLKKKYADKADIVDGLSRMEQAVWDSMNIFEFAKMYEQLGSEVLIPINVESKLTEAITLFSCELPEIINECHNLTILADSFLRQLFYNFLDNTRKYGEKTTRIRVRYEKTNSGDLHLIYEDDGVGISSENKSKLFTEGFSTGGSTGFGLFLVRKMMDVYGWKIQEVGEAGRGVRFVITVPEKNKSGQANYQIKP